MRFTDKVCLVTGGGSGIGRAACQQFAAEGGKVVIVDINEETGTETEKIITLKEGQSIFVKADIASSADVQAVVNTVINKWGKIDILVNNAAVMTFKRIIDLCDDEWDRVIAVNLRSVFLFCKYCLPHMKQGAIINVSSVHAHKTDVNVAPYAASKGAIEALTRALSCDFASSKVRVNCVAPGGVNTPLLWSNPTIKGMNPKDVLYSEPAEIAAAICFLASDEASSINGIVLLADRGALSAL